MSASSNEERDSNARRTTQSRTSGLASNMFSGMDDGSPANFIQPPTQKRDHRKYDKERPKPHLDWSDFLACADELIEGDRPEIVDNLVEHLTGVRLEAVKQRISEEEEYTGKLPVMPRANNDDQLADYKKTIPEAHYKAITGAFARLYGSPTDDETAQVDGYAALTEAKFVKNIKEVINIEGVEEPYFGKMLYLWLARGYDRAKITISEFIEALLPFRGDNKPK